MLLRCPFCPLQMSCSSCASSLSLHLSATYRQVTVQSLSQVQPPFHPLYRHSVKCSVTLGSSRGLGKTSTNSTDSQISRTGSPIASTDLISLDMTARVQLFLPAQHSPQRCDPSVPNRIVSGSRCVSWWAGVAFGRARAQGRGREAAHYCVWIASRSLDDFVRTQPASFLAHS